MYNKKKTRNNLHFFTIRETHVVGRNQKEWCDMAKFKDFELVVLDNSNTVYIKIAPDNESEVLIPLLDIILKLEQMKGKL